MNEQEIATLLQSGESQRAVAARLGCNPVTIGRIAARLGIVSRRGQASAKARRGQTLRQTEREFQDAVIEAAQLNGWMVHHQWTAIHSTAGWPDLALARKGRLVLAELKSETGTVSPAQQAWLEVLATVPGIEVRLWRPSDWPEIERTLARED